MSERDGEDEFTTSILRVAKLNPVLRNCIISGPPESLCRDVLVYDPTPKNMGTFSCPFCKRSLNSTELFSGEMKKYPSRTIRDIQKNVALCSRMFECQTCGYILGHHEDMLDQAKNNNLFILSHRSGFTFRAVSLIISSIIRGSSIHSANPKWNFETPYLPRNL